MEVFSDVPIDLTVAVKQKRRRSSFFDIPPSKVPEKCVKLDEYVEKIQTEMANWYEMARRVEKRTTK